VPLEPHAAAPPAAMAVAAGLLLHLASLQNRCCAQRSWALHRRHLQQTAPCQCQSMDLPGTPTACGTQCSCLPTHLHWQMISWSIENLFGFHTSGGGGLRSGSSTVQKSLHTLRLANVHSHSHVVAVWRMLTSKALLQYVLYQLRNIV
jgi:hypothetical protein